MKDRLFKELTLCETQQILAQWLVQTGLLENQTIEATLIKLNEEVKETEIETLKDPIDKESLGKEIADILWVAINLATVYGIDINEMMLKVMDKNWNRYNPAKAQALQAEGMTVFESLKQLKSEY